MTTTCLYKISDRFSPAARTCAQQAQNLARYRGFDHVPPELLLLSLSQADNTIAQLALYQLNVTPEHVVVALDTVTPATRAQPKVAIFGVDTIVLFSRAEQIALDMGTEVVGTSHLLLAFFAPGSESNTAAVRRVMECLGLKPKQSREIVVALIDSRPDLSEAGEISPKNEVPDWPPPSADADDNIC